MDFEYLEVNLTTVINSFIEREMKKHDWVYVAVDQNNNKVVFRRMKKNGEK